MFLILNYALRFLLANEEWPLCCNLHAKAWDWMTPAITMLGIFERAVACCMCVQSIALFSPWLPILVLYSLPASIVRILRIRVRTLPERTLLSRNGPGEHIPRLFLNRWKLVVAKAPPRALPICLRACHQVQTFRMSHHRSETTLDMP
jgi:hypothetical protein